MDRQTLNPAASPYTAFYCEENVWHLARSALQAEGEARVAFISNPTRTVAVFQQRAAGAEAYVVWDYHVILLTRGWVGTRRPAGAGHSSGGGAAAVRRAARASHWMVWDLDTRLEIPVAAQSYLEATFPNVEGWPQALRPRFRWLSAADYVAHFSSDRAHMRDDEGAWRAPPPAWPPIGEGRPSNLAALWDTTAPGLGETGDLAAFAASL